MKNQASSVLRGFALIITMALVSLALYTWTHWSPAGQVYVVDDPQYLEIPYRLRNAAEHDAALLRNGGNPYLLHLNTARGGSLLYYGASHTNDPADPQIAHITRQWDDFAPTVALYEGRSRGYFYGALIEPFAGLPEPALVHKLARRDDVVLFTLEPAYEDEVRALLQQFTAEQVALYFFLRVYSSEAGGQANEALAQDLLQKRTNIAGLQGVLANLDAVDSLWARDFAGERDWRVIQTEPGYLEEISHLSRQVRGEHMIRTLVDLVEQGERVFAVVGSGHVIRQEWNLRALLGQEPAWDQPATSTSR